MAAVYWPSHQKMFGDVMSALLSPYVIGTMGYRAWPDAHFWRLFVRACLGFVAFNIGMLVEPRLCGLPGAEFFHAVVSHIAIVVTFGHVTFLALRLLWHGPRRKAD